MPVHATGFFEAWDLFSVQVPQGWVYQVSESTDNLLVFYGPGVHDLIYIEHLGLVSDDSALDFAERVIESYNSINGLPDFYMEQPLKEHDLDGVAVAEGVYHFQGRVLQTEKRLFIINSGQGISITYSNATKNFFEKEEDFQKFLANWRWLVVE